MFMAVSLPPGNILPPVAEVSLYLDFLPIFWQMAKCLSTTLPSWSTTASPPSSSECSARPGRSTARPKAFPTSTTPSARPSQVWCTTKLPGVSLDVEHGLDRLEPGRPDLRAGDEPRRARARLGARRAAPAPTTAARASSASAPVPSCSARPACSTAGSAPPTGGTSTSSRSASPMPRSSATCCTSTRARSSPRPARQPASTPACTSSAASSAHRRLHGRPPDGGGAAPRRRPGPVHPVAGAGRDRRHAAAVARVDVGPPRRGPERRRAGQQGA